MKEGLKKRLARFSAPKGALSDDEINKIETFRDRMLGGGSQEPRLEDGSPLPEGMVPGFSRTADYRDVNQNGIEDRDEGIFRRSDLVPESDMQRRGNIDPGFYRPIPSLEDFPGMGQGLRPPGRVPPPSINPVDPGPQQMKPRPPLEVPPGLGQDFDEEEREQLEKLLRKAEVKQMSPLGEIADRIAELGEGEDTQLAHLRPGEVVLPPEFFDDEKFEKVIEGKFKEFDIDPEEAVVGGGIASLNPVTGLEQFGFFKKIGKSLKKFAKKIAPVAGPLANFIPGVGPVLAGAIGAGTNLAAGKGIKGALTGGLGGYGAGRLFGGIGGLGTVGGKVVGPGGFQNLGFLDKFRALGSGVKAGIGNLFGMGQQGVPGQGVGPQPGFDVASGNYDANTGMFVDQFGNSVDAATYQQYISDPSSIPMVSVPGMGGGQGQVGGQQQGQGFFRDKILDDLLGFDPGGPGSGKGIYGVFPGMGQGQGQGQGGGGGFLSGGLGDALKLGGIGALAAGLGKLAYEDAKKQTGVPLTPLTTMSPTGRYNIEAEIARRMGQAAPNPVEFGLLPQGTIPELSGGKPRMAALGGAIEDLQKNMAYGGGVYGNGLEDLQGGMVSGMMMGGPVMQYAQGGAVQMQEGGELDLDEFPRKDGPINGPGTETSDDIPAMLSDGEYVMTSRAVRGAGSFQLDNNNGIISLIPGQQEDREQGMKNMYRLMDMFESSAQPSN